LFVHHNPKNIQPRTLAPGPRMGKSKSCLACEAQNCAGTFARSCAQRGNLELYNSALVTLRPPTAPPLHVHVPSSRRSARRRRLRRLRLLAADQQEGDAVAKRLLSRGPRRRRRATRCADALRTTAAASSIARLAPRTLQRTARGSHLGVRRSAKSRVVTRRTLRLLFHRGPVRTATHQATHSPDTARHAARQRRRRRRLGAWLRP
jgi:hypothetical protein